MNDVHSDVATTSSAQQRPLSGFGIARALGKNALLALPPQAFDEDFITRRFLGRRQIILNRPAGIHHILVEHTENYRRTRPTIRILRPLLGTGLLLSEGDDWKYQRRTLAPAFAARTIPMLAHHIAKAAATVISKLSVGDKRPVDLLAEMQFLALEIAGRSMFSVATERYGAAMRRMITTYAGHLGRPSLLDFLLPRTIPSPRDIARRRVRRRWVDLIGQIIAERTAIGPSSDLFDLLSTARDPETGTGFSGEQLLDQVATMIIAGHETTAVALFWALYLIAITPEVQERLAAEVENLDFSPEAAAEALPKLIYTRAVVQETLRLYPPVFSVIRQARDADSADGVEIPADAIVMISPWVLHRHRRLWARPEMFDPSRFLPGAQPPERFTYLPFGAGPRVCIGGQFALTEATLVLGSMVRAFQIERADNEPVTPFAMVTTQPDHPPLFWLHRRRGDASR